MLEVSASAGKRHAAFRSITGAAFITVLKLITGIATGSLGILAEAAHSGLDLVAAGITYLAVRVSDKPADASHPYGHQKIENFSAFLEIGLLLATCAWIIFEATRRLLGAPAEVEATVAAFAVMIVSIVVDITRSRMLKRAADKYSSQALEADALHFSTDVWSSAVVILGLVAVRLGNHFRKPELQMADPVAALIVAMIILVVSARLGKKAVAALLDEAPAGLADSIRGRLDRVEGVVSVDRVRTRHAGNQYFVDVNLTVDSRATIEQAKQVSDAAESAIRDLAPGADVMIQTHPAEPGVETLFDRVKKIAARRQWSVHDLSVYENGRGLGLEFHLEVDGDLSLDSAHRMVTELEAEIQREVPQVSAILTHIENEAAAEMCHRLLPDSEAAAWSDPLREIARSFPEVLQCHQVTVFGSSDRPSVSCHCVFHGDLPVHRVHGITHEIENRLRRVFPQLDRVTIHPEPHTELE